MYTLFLIQNMRNDRFLYVLYAHFYSVTTVTSQFDVITPPTGCIRCIDFRWRHWFICKILVFRTRIYLLIECRHSACFKIF